MEKKIFEFPKGENVICTNCIKEKMRNSNVYILWNDINIRLVGFKGKYEFYIRCPRCFNNTVISEENIPFRVKKSLLKTLNN